MSDLDQMIKCLRANPWDDRYEPTTNDIADQMEKMRAALCLIAGMESSARPDHMGSIAAIDAECRAGSMRDHARMQVIARAALQAD